MLRSIVFLSILLTTLTRAANTPACIDGFALVNNKCLKLVTTLVNHAAAERTCMDSGATLVTIKNAIDNRAVSSFVGNSASLLWIGLFCSDSSVERCYWDDSTGSAAPYSSFSNGFPLVDVGRCVYYSAQGALAGKWLNGDCDNELRAFVCELPTTFSDSCALNYNGNCYSFHSPSTFFTAQQVCQQECGDLASIHSANENRYINTLMKNISGSVLIGAVHSAPHSFTWADGSAWDYSNVDIAHLADSSCLEISNGISSDVPSGFWYSTSCSSTHSFVCKRPAGIICNATPPPVIVTPAPSNPSKCNSTILWTGTITSPNYPNNYDNNQFCSYFLETLGPYQIFLKFNTFLTEHNYDNVTVFNSDNTQLGIYSGNLSPFSVESPGSMLVTFRTDGSNVYQGFTASFSSVPL